MEPPPQPTSALGRHRLLAPNASVRVSPICLGGLSFGTVNGQFLGSVDKNQTFEILDYFWEQGGNFVDTASNYQNGQSETWIGEWMEQRGRRDEMVIATKYTTAWRTFEGHDHIQQSNYGGTGTKSLRTSVEASLKKLRTTYIDLLYVHYWDMNTRIPELMQSLNQLVASGKVLYLGISDTPAWVVVKANCYARQHGLRPFSVYQGRWSAAIRDLERDIIPMCKDEGMGIAPWGALGGGYFKPKDQWGKEGRNMPTYATGKEIEVSEKLENVAKRHNTVMTSIALAYVMHKALYVFPICGQRKIEHLKSNIEALSIRLTDEDIAEIETGYDWDPGFPHTMLSGHEFTGKVFHPKEPKDIWFTKWTGHHDYVQEQKPIVPHQG